MKELRKRRIVWGVVLGCVITCIAGCRSFHWAEIQLRVPETLLLSVTDQGGEPVRGAHLKLLASETHIGLMLFVYSQPLVRTIEAVSDSNGTVSIRFKHEELRLEEVKKTGYEFDEVSNTLDWYRRRPPGVTPLTTNLVLYDVLNPSAPRPSVVVQEPVNLDRVENEYWLDLVGGKMTQEQVTADVYLSVIFHGEKCLVTVVAISGGVCLCRNDFPYAPKKGLSEGFAHLGSSRGISGSYNFYVVSRDGRVFSRVLADLDLGRRVLRVSHITNTNSSPFIHHEARRVFSTPRVRMEGGLIRWNDDWWVDRGSLIQGYNVLLPTEEYYRLYGDGKAGSAIHHALLEQLFTPLDVLKQIVMSEPEAASHIVSDHPLPPEELLGWMSINNIHSPSLLARARTAVEKAKPLRSLLLEKGYWAKISGIRGQGRTKSE